MHDLEAILFLQHLTTAATPYRSISRSDLLSDRTRSALHLLFALFAFFARCCLLLFGGPSEHGDDLLPWILRREIPVYFLEVQACP